MKVSGVKYLVDAGPLVGAFWAADRWHAWSRATLASIGAPVFTTETVFAEAAHHLKASSTALLQLFAALDAGRVRFDPVYPLQIGRAAELVRDYAPRADAGDASLVILSERHRRATFITLDRANLTPIAAEIASTSPLDASALTA